MKKEKIKCSECEYCKEARYHKRDSSDFTCEHSDREYIREYFEEHRMQKMAGYLGSGKRYSHEVPVRTSPAWCPKKKAQKKGEGCHGEKAEA